MEIDVRGTYQGPNKHAGDTRVRITRQPFEFSTIFFFSPLLPSKQLFWLLTMVLVPQPTVLVLQSQKPLLSQQDSNITDNMKGSSTFATKAATVLLLSTATLFILTPSSPSSPKLPLLVDAFQPSCGRHHGMSLDQIQHQSTTAAANPTRRFRRRNSNRLDTTDVIAATAAAASTSLFSSIGGDRPPPPPSDDDNNNGGGDLGDFLDPMRKPDSENLKRARQFMSETSLPLSFDAVDEDEDDEEEDKEENVTATIIDTTSAASSSLTSSAADSRFNNSASSSALFGTDGAPSSDLLAKNPYMQVVSKISPSDVIAKFTATSDPRVQEAVRTTILGLIGSLPKMAFETTSITTGQRLASLVGAE